MDSTGFAILGVCLVSLSCILPTFVYVHVYDFL